MVVQIILAIAAAIIVFFAAFTVHRINKLKDMTFEDMLAYTSRGRENAVIAVGIIQNGEVSYSFYGGSASVLPQKEYIFEIGSITKTFTAALLYKAISEGRASLDDSIDKYLDLPEKRHYPTLRQLITHTSGYKSYYFTKQIIPNKLAGRNDFFGFSRAKLIDRLGKIHITDGTHKFKYSNFGIAVMGAILSEIYSGSFSEIMDEFIKTDLGLGRTQISDASGNLGNYWEWAKDDAYISAGALTSTIEDMASYAQIQLDSTYGCMSDTHRVLEDIDATNIFNRKMDINLDAIGAAWVIDRKNNIIWHNGGTGSYNSYLGFDSEKNIAVVVLANLPPGFRIPTTVMGVRLLTDLQRNWTRSA